MEGKERKQEDEEESLGFEGDFVSVRRLEEEEWRGFGEVEVA